MKPAILTQFIPGRGCDCALEEFVKDWDGTLLSIGPSLECLEQRGLPTANLYAYCVSSSAQPARQAVRQRREAARGLLKSGCVAAREDGWSAATLDAAHDAVCMLWDDDAVWNEIETAYGAMHAAMEEYDIQLILVSDTFYPTNRLYAALGRHYNIPSLELAHGVPGYNYSPQARTCGSDYVAVYNAFIRARYIGFGVHPDRIFITGNPAWDLLQRAPSLMQRDADCRHLGLDPARPVITYGMTWTYDWLYLDLTKAVLDVFVRLSARHPSWQFVLRPHPTSLANKVNPTDVVGLAQQYKSSALSSLVLEALPVARSLAVADLVITSPSGLVNDGILAGKAVIVEELKTLRKHRVPEDLSILYGDTNAVRHAQTPEALESAIEDIMTSPETRARLYAARPSAVRHFNLDTACCATQRVTALMGAIIRHGSNADRVRDAYIKSLPAAEEISAPFSHAATETPLDVAYAELCGFTGLPPDEVRQCMQEQVARTARLFNEGHAEGEDAWYRTTDAYLFELANWEGDPLRLALAESLANGSAGRRLDMLEYGCGIGTFALALARHNFSVWACDVNERHIDFLAYRIKERGWQERITLVSPEEALSRVRAYHIVSAQHVLEHMPDPLGALRKMAACLKPGGVFLGIAPFELVGPMFPEHNPDHAHMRLEDLCREVGLEVQNLIPFGEYQGHPFTLVQAVKPL